MLAEAAAVRGFKVAPLLLMLADAAAVTVYTGAAHFVVLADATADILFAAVSLPLVLVDHHRASSSLRIITETPHQGRRLEKKIVFATRETHVNTSCNFILALPEFIVNLEKYFFKYLLVKESKNMKNITQKDREHVSATE